MHGNTLDSFIDYLAASKNSSFYFHNLKFDGEFLIAWLFNNGFEHVRTKEEERSKTFTTLISDMNQFYTMKIIFEKNGKFSKYVNIYDSMKILPFSVDNIAKGFGLPISKLKIDYEAYREPGHILSQEEVDYLRNDVLIVAKALKVLFNQDLKKMTQGSNALADFKATIGKKNFERWFPTPDYDADVRQSYRGGFTYLNPDYKEKDIKTGLVLDVNSLYPSVMHDCKLPYGEPLFFKGRYQPDKFYELYVQMFRCHFKLKEGYIPTVQMKGNFSFIQNEYVTDSRTRNKQGDLVWGEPVALCMTSVDLELFLEHYEVIEPEWFSGWKFKSHIGMFTDYIDKWMNVKIEASKTKNKPMRSLAKLMLNALYGKFATNPRVCSKYPVMEDGVVKYKLPRDADGDIEYEYRKPLYIPVGTFITAWARYKTITSAQKVKHMFAYADTDSLHLEIDLPESILKMSNDELEELTTKDLKAHGIPIPDDFEVDPVKLGAWKIESKFNRARFIRQKSYIEDWNLPETWGAEKFSSAKLKEQCEKDGENFDEIKKHFEGWYDTDLLNITCAGMPKECYDYVSWENFHEGQMYPGKLRPVHVNGGIVLEKSPFSIRKC